eukprot:15463434-Alexandrium_andersonii.AAC.1
MQECAHASVCVHFHSKRCSRAASPAAVVAALLPQPCGREGHRNMHARPRAVANASFWRSAKTKLDGDDTESKLKRLS